MVYLKWAFWIVVWVCVGAFFHYTLPQRDVVRITDTYEKRIDFGENSIFWANQGTGEAEGTPNRDVFFIQSVQTNGRPMVYRNEDTGWAWPPYFKFDTSNLQAEASDLISKSGDANEKWAVVRHYGWRIVFLSTYPNAISVRQVDGPDYALGLPWLNISILTLFLAFVYAIWVRIRRFRENRIDPVLEDIEEGWDAAGDRVSDTRGRVRRWWQSWRG